MAHPCTEGLVQGGASVISRQELLALAADLGLRPGVVEKDYVLAWVLAGIDAQPALRGTWVFKGGTCLKKCYFETYRFSEDLDFTITEVDHLDGAFLRQIFERVGEWVYENSGIEIPADTLRFDIYTNPRGNRSCNGKFGYRGPIAPGGSLPRIKLDVTADETLVLEPVAVRITHPYSDHDAELFVTTAYCFEELFAEKIRALAERLRPRDLYDVINLYRHEEFTPQLPRVRETLRRKCSFKEIGYPSFDTVSQMPQRAELEAEWANMLEHQLRALPPFDHFWNALGEFFEWLEGARKPAALDRVRAPGTVPFHERGFRSSAGLRVPLGTIRFAAANRLCVDLRYSGKSRMIEPYSLRRAADGNVLLYAVRAGTTEVRSYRVDRIEDAAVTSTPFVPLFTVELSPTNLLPLPPATRRTPIRASSKRPRSPSGSANWRYVVECSFCGKRFYRKKYSASIKPHKDRDGTPCSGRSGQIADSR